MRSLSAVSLSLAPRCQGNTERSARPTVRHSLPRDDAISGFLAARSHNRETPGTAGVEVDLPTNWLHEGVFYVVT